MKFWPFSTAQRRQQIEQPIAEAREIEITFKGDLQKVKTEPGDVFILKIDCHLTHGQARDLEAYVRARIGDLPVLILDRDMALEVGRRPRDPETGTYLHLETKGIA